MNNSIMPIYDQIGKGYDFTRKADHYLASRIASHLQLDRTGQYLDVACGTGNYTTTLQAEYGGSWFGADASSQMITEARDKSINIDWTVADCSSLPFTANSFTGVSITTRVATIYSSSLRRLNY